MTGTSEDFYIYDNSGRGWGSQPYAKIHVGSCSYCNYGKGMHGVKNTERVNDEWQGPIESKEKAVEVANTLGKPVSFCPCVELYEVRQLLAG